MPATTSRPVALLGLGAMGSRLGARLLDAGHDLRVWTRTPGAATEALAAGGAHVATDPADAVAGARAVLVCVRDDEASTAVWDAAAPGLAEDATLVELSTVTPGHARALAGRFGPRLVEAPMVGSRPQVEAGKLQLLVAGDAAPIDGVDDLLGALAGAVHRVGAPGDAAVLKLAINGLLAVQHAAVGEVLALVRDRGLDPEAAGELIAGMPVAAPVTGLSLPRILAGDTAPLFPLELVAKDLGYLLAETGEDAPVLAAVRAAVDARVAGGRGAEDVVALAAAPPA